MRKLSVLLLALCTMAVGAVPQQVLMPGKSPLVTFRFVFLTGAASDPVGKPGLANLTCEMLAASGSKQMTYKQTIDALFPMATAIESYTDKQMMVFTAETHVDNLDKFYAIFKAMLLEPGWREEDFRRVKDDQINALKVNLRGNNDEELAKEELYSLLYAGGPYGHENLGTVSALDKLTIEDVKAFYKAQLTRGNLIIGLAGGYPADFPARVEKDFGVLPKVAPAVVKLGEPAAAWVGNKLTIIQKDTRSVAYSLGFPLDVKRGDADFPALLLMQSYFGQHRDSGGRLYQRMREIRGLNYGDYAYIEYFPGGMFQFEPLPNMAREQQIFQMWIRPVEEPTAAFALKLALFELDNLVKNGLSEEDFQRTRSFVSKQVNLLMKTKSAELGYRIDSAFYGMGEYNASIKSALAGLTRERVNAAIRKHLRVDGLQIVAVAKDAEGLKAALTGSGVTGIVYNSAKDASVMAEDKTVERWDLKIRDVVIVPVDRVFQ
jgi:zinc protease